MQDYAQLYWVPMQSEVWPVTPQAGYKNSFFDSYNCPSLADIKWLGLVLKPNKINNALKTRFRWNAVKEPYGMSSTVNEFIGFSFRDWDHQSPTVLYFIQLPDEHSSYAHYTAFFFLEHENDHKLLVHYSQVIHAQLQDIYWHRTHTPVSAPRMGSPAMFFYPT